ncbi:amino acid permease-domain-containing protein [Dichotomopilus funicola]|uniref:Amino acid permease-domain-containing protein n=1 Tax=Dichotomopilus funicola TaxID=1934379 RepID=A0AAN6V1K2_9PEZI|nr:amino acid permease-domain-containing protein [Dichotomopilus funicola]
MSEPDVETPLLYNTNPGPREHQEVHRSSPSSSSTSSSTKKPLHHRSSNSSSSSETAAPLLAPRTVEDDTLPETAVLGRNLGWSSAYILIISRVIGSGIFATPGAIVSSVGSIGLSLLLWVAGAVISWAGLMVALEYGCMLPRSGGQKVYLEFTYRWPRFFASTLVAVHAVVMGFTASNCIVFGEYVLFALGWSPGENPVLVRVLAVALMTGITVLHAGFMKTGILVQNVLGWVKIGLVVFTTVSAGVVVVSRYVRSGGSGDETGTGLFGLDTASATGPTVVVPGAWDGIWEGSVWNWGVISPALFKVFYSYSGLTSVNNVMNEVRDPVRTLRSAAPTALVTTCLLYLLVNVAYFLVLPLDEIKKSGELVAALFFERVFGQSFGKLFLPLAVAVSAAGSVMVVTFALARVNQEIARQGLLPFGEFLSSSRPFGSPLGGVILHYIPSVIVIAIPFKNIYSFILEVEGYPGQFFTFFISLGLIRLRWTRPDLHRPYKAFILAAWFGLFLSTSLILAPFIPLDNEDWGSHLARVSYALVGISVLLFGVLYWAVLTIFLPRWGGYRLDEVTDVLEDGTTITKLVHIPKDR